MSDTIGYTTLQVIPSLKGAERELDAQFAKIADRYELNPPVRPELDDDQAKKAGSRWGDAMVGGMVGVGALAGKVLTDDLVRYVEQDKTGDRIAAVLNFDQATDEQMRRVGRGLHEALSVETIEDAYALVGSIKSTWRDLGNVSDQELTRLSAGVGAVAVQWDASNAEIAAGVETLWQQHMIPSYQEGVDLLAGLGAKIPEQMRGDFLDIFTEGEYLEFFERMGYNATDMGNAIVRAAEDGTFALDKMPDALAEFNKIMLDGVTPEQQKWFNQLGLSSWQFTQALKKGGPEARAELEGLLTGLSKLSEEERNIAARDFFGTPGEDIGADNIFASLLPTEDQLGELDGRANELGARMSDQVNAGWERWWRENENTRQVGFDRLLNDFGGSMSVLAEGAGQVIEKVENDFGDGLAVLGEGFGRYFDTVEEAFGEIPGWLGGAWEQIEDVVGRVPEFFGGVWENVENFFGGIPEKVGAAFDPVEEILTAPFRAAIDAWNALDPSIHIQIPDWVPGIGGRSFDIDDLFPDIPAFDDGGIVPGARGSAQLILAHGGETVLPTHKDPGAGQQVINYSPTFYEAHDPYETADISSRLIASRVQPRGGW